MDHPEDIPFALNLSQLAARHCVYHLRRAHHSGLSFMPSFCVDFRLNVYETALTVILIEHDNGFAVYKGWMAWMAP